MNQRSNLALSVDLLAGMLLWSAVVHADPSIYPTGVTRYDPAKAYNVFILFSGSPPGDDKTHLIDMGGNEVRRWGHRGFPSGMLDPALVGGARGHVMVQLADMAGSETGMIPGMPPIFKNKTIGELDWDGNVVWQWGDAAPGGAAQQHHDWARLPNGNTLVLSVVSYQIPGFALPKQLDDAIYEVTPNGDIVWKWIAGDHLDELGFTPEALELVRRSEIPDYLHVNSMKPLGPNHWFRDGDARFNPDNIMISSREANFTIIIDKETGHVAWARLSADAEGPASLAIDHRPDQRTARSASHRRGSSRRRRPAGVRQSGCGGLSSGYAQTLPRLACAGDRSREATDRLGIYRQRQRRARMELLQLVHQRCPPLAQRQHFHR